MKRIFSSRGLIIKMALPFFNAHITLHPQKDMDASYLVAMQRTTSQGTTEERYALNDDTGGDNEHVLEERGTADTSSSSQAETAVLVLAQQPGVMWKWKAFVFFFGIVLPILGMLQCSGWNEAGTGELSCHVIDTSFARSYADACYGWVLMFAFSGGIFMGVYFALLWLVYKLGQQVIRRFMFSRQGQAALLLE